MNSYASHLFVLLLTIFWCIPLQAISIVYNMRISHVTKSTLLEPDGRKYAIFALAFDQYQAKYTGCINQNFAGLMGSASYNFLTNWYARIDGAFAHINQTTAGVETFSDTETDDVLFYLGHISKLNDRAKLTISGLFSIPTHRIFTLQHAAFGYGQYGVGIQLDGAYDLGCDLRILYGARYVHLISRDALGSDCNHYDFTIGNLGDLLIAMKKKWDLHGLEWGYTARWNFGAHVSPCYDNIIAQINYTRNNFYLVYNYDFFVHNVRNRLYFNIAYGFDSKPKMFGNKHIVTGWFSWNLKF